MILSKDEEIIKRGYKSYPAILVPSQENLQILENLKHSKVLSIVPQIHLMDLKSAYSDTKSFYNTFFRVHKIPTIRAFNIGPFNVKIPMHISPFSLPLSLVDGEDIFDCSIEEIITHDLNKFIYFLKISLCSLITELTSATWCHEITHSQLDSQKGVVKEFYNAEVLSILVENIHALLTDEQERLLRVCDLRRLNEMTVLTIDLYDYFKGQLPKSREDLLLDSQYYSSNIKAYKLFLIYYYGSNKIKKELIRDIQRVFDFEITLEELLGKYEVTIDMVQDKKTLIKYFNR